MATEAKLNRSKMRRLLGKAGELEREADDMRTAGLDERAEKLEADAEKIRNRVQASKKAHQREQLERLKRNKEAERRHEEAQKRREAELARSTAAREWFESWAAFYGGRPQPRDQVLESAEAAGHDEEDVLSALTECRRLKDGTECLGIRGTWLRSEYRALDRFPGRVKA